MIRANVIFISAILATFSGVIARGQDRAFIGEKHYGSVCARLTKDSECKACALDATHHWNCDSRNAAKAAPRSKEDLSDVPEVTRLGDKSANFDTSSCWSSKYDEITDSNLKLNLLRDRAFVTESLGRSIQRAGGIDQFLLQFERQIVAFRYSQAQGTSTAEAFGSSHPIDQLILFAEGGIEMAHCIAGLGTGSGGVTALPSQPLSRSEPAKIPGKNPNCKELAVYRDAQLIKDFDLAIAKYDIFKQGKLSAEDLEKKTLNLMNDHWWRTQTMVKVAIEVKFYADAFNDIVGLINPLESKTLKLAQATAVNVDLIKTWEEEGAKKAVEDGATELVKEVARGGGSFLGLGLDELQYQERQKGMATFQSEVQRQVRSVEKAVKNYQVNMVQSKARTQAIADLVASIDKACSPVPIFNPLN